MEGVTPRVQTPRDGVAGAPALEVCDPSHESHGEGAHLWSSTSSTGSSPPSPPEELSLALGLGALGVLQGTVISSYLASVGLFTAKFHTEYLWGLQNVVVFAVSVFVLALQTLLDDKVDSSVGAERSYPCRIIVCGLFASGLLLLVPLCNAPYQVLVVGGFLSFFGFAHFSSVMQLSSTMTKGGGIFVSCGCTLGGLLPMATTPLTGFKAGANQAAQFQFYLAACCVGVIITTYWAYVHFSGSNRQPTCCESLRGTPRRQSLGALTHGAYYTMDNAPMMPSGTEAAISEDVEDPQGCLGVFAQGATTLRSFCFGSDWSPNGLCIAICMMAGFATVPEFTLTDPYRSQSLFLAKCFGDAIGRIPALLHSRRCSERGSVGAWTRTLAILLVGLRVAIAVVVIVYLLVNGSHAMVYWLTLIGFATGGYGLLMLDLDAQLESKGPRKNVQRQNLFLMICGQMGGLIIGLILVRKYGKHSAHMMNVQ